jgi:hypothetical protein
MFTPVYLLHVNWHTTLCNLNLAQSQVCVFVNGERLGDFLSYILSILLSQIHITIGPSILIILI